MAYILFFLNIITGGLAMGTTISWHFEKHSMGAVNGLQRHNERDAAQHKNERIDIDRSQNNINAVEPDMIGKTYQQRIKTRLDEFYTGKRAPRKDAIVDVQHSIQFGGDVFNELPGEKRLEVMQTASDFLIQRIGGHKNVLDLNYHRDETSDHVHMDTIPLLDDGRLSAKELYSRQFMKETQADLLSFMQERFPELEFERADKMGRGFENGRSQADFERLRDEQRSNQELYEEQQKELTEAERALNRDRKNQALDILEIAEPDLIVQRDTYDNQFRVASEPGKFVKKYGFKPEPIKKPEGRRQFFDWIQTDWVIERSKQAWNLIKNRLEQLTSMEKLFEKKEHDLQRQEGDMYFDLIETISGSEINEDMRVSQVVYSNSEAENLHKEAEKLIAEGVDKEDERVKSKLEKKASDYYGQALKGYIKGNITQPKEMLADVAIGLGVHPSWRETMVAEGGMVGKAQDGRVINKPFSELIPERLQKATANQLQQVNRRIQQQHNSDQGFGRGR